MDFPIAILEENDPIIYVYKDDKTLRKTSEELLKEGVWHNCEIIDSIGRRFSILEVKKIGLRGLFGWVPALKGKSIWVDFNFSELRRVELDEFKLLVINKLGQNPDFWEKGWDVEELKEEIRNSISFKEVIELLR